MPYIAQSERDRVDPHIEQLLSHLHHDEDGVVNYTVTRIIDHIYGAGGKTRKYAVYNRALGVLDCVAKEFYRRRVAPYEDEKIMENGDVY